MNKIQYEELEIMKYFHSFAEDNNIVYCLYAGTLLGAIRHKGFIPWDDDIDIALPREEFERFESLFKKSDYKNDGFFYQSSDTDKYYPAPFTKIRSNTMNVRENITNKHIYAKGPWIDLFPYDNVPDDEVLRREQYNKVAHYNKLLRFFLLAKTTDRDSGIKKMVKQFVISVNNLLTPVYFFVPYLIKKRNYYMTMYNNQETKCSGELCYLYFKNYEHYARTIMDNREFDNLELAPFETESFYIPKNFDVVLKDKFGEYMQLPPEDERKVHDFVVEE